MDGFRLIVFVLALAGCQKAQDDAIADIHNQVAEDAVAQYEMVERHGSVIEKCVHAGLVSAAYLQAKDEEKYRFWKVIEDLACATAGMP